MIARIYIVLLGIQCGFGFGQTDDSIHTSNASINMFYSYLLSSGTVSSDSMAILFDWEYELVTIAKMYRLDQYAENVEEYWLEHKEKHGDQSVALKLVRENKNRFLPPSFTDSGWTISVSQEEIFVQPGGPDFVNEFKLIFENQAGKSYAFFFLISKGEVSGMIGQLEIVEIYDFQRTSLLQSLF